ncbi:MAG: DUF2620 domain-containing protein [Acholeplasma sp.]|nr:DUF2620 domain-containing protein [Acholeplasma sp.]
MLRIVVGGQLAKNEIAEKIKELGKENVEVKVLGDLAAAMAVKKKEADYYFGACATGGGGSLAMAIALLGMDKCVTVSMPSKMLNEKEMIDALSQGKIAFGFVSDTRDHVLKTLIPEIIKKDKGE